ncbi:MAG: acetyl-CoA carboxylase biotin carboxyl carrier protein [bacterium]
MKLEELKELIQIVKKNGIQELDIEEKGVKVRIVVASDNARVEYVAQPVPHYMGLPPPTVLGPLPTSPMVPTPVSAGEKKGEGEEEELPANAIHIKSPMVGTFYRSPAPDSPAYVEVGDEIVENTVLCIVEAMKLMNEIKAEMKGKILKVLLENGSPVEYGQPLFLVETI